MGSGKKDDPTRRATFQEAIQGIYIDFEGFTDKAPVLLGKLIQYDFEQIVLDETYSSAALAKGLRVSRLEDEIEEILRTCEKSGRKVFAFTRHELDVVGKYTKLGPELERVYKDGQKIARRWYNKTHYGKPLLDRSLASFLDFIGEPHPANLGMAVATKRLRTVREQLVVREEYDELTPVAKRKWTNLLSYNKLDCTGLRDLTLLATW